MKHMKTGIHFLVICMTICAVALWSQAQTVKLDQMGFPKSKLEMDLKAKEALEKLTEFEGKLILLNENAPKFLQKASPEGPRSGGGGNSCALNINENTQQLLRTLEQMPQLLTEQQKVSLQSHISKAAFYLKDNLFKNGEAKDAINFPEKNQIYVSPKLCKWQLVEVSGAAMALLLHEYLGLAKIDDSKYQISGKFLTQYSEMVAIAPILNKSTIDEKLYRAVVYKFLNEANNPASALGKKIAQLNAAAKDGRNEDGVISSPLTKNDIQVVVTSSLSLGNLWESADRVNDTCIATASTADYLIYLSATANIHTGTALSTMTFKTSSQRNLYAKVLKKHKVFCGELLDDGSKFSKPVERAEVSDFEWVD